MSYWANVKGLLGLIAMHTEQADRSVRNLRDVAVMGDVGDELDAAKADAALRDLRVAVGQIDRLLPTLQSLTESARRVSSNDPSKQVAWHDRPS